MRMRPLEARLDIFTSGGHLFNPAVGPRAAKGDMAVLPGRWKATGWWSEAPGIILEHRFKHWKQHLYTYFAKAIIFVGQ